MPEPWFPRITQDAKDAWTLRSFPQVTQDDFPFSILDFNCKAPLVCDLFVYKSLELECGYLRITILPIRVASFGDCLGNFWKKDSEPSSLFVCPTDHNPWFFGQIKEEKKLFREWI